MLSDTRLTDDPMLLATEAWDGAVMAKTPRATAAAATIFLMMLILDFLPLFNQSDAP